MNLFTKQKQSYAVENNLMITGGEGREYKLGDWD